MSARSVAAERLPPNGHHDDGHGAALVTAVHPPAGRDEPVDQDRAAREHLVPLGLAVDEVHRRVPDDPAAVLVPELDVVVRRQEAGWGRRVRIGQQPIRHVEQLLAVLVAERAQLRPQCLDVRLELRQPRPCLDVHHARRPERAQVAQDQVGGVGVGADVAPEPQASRREDRLPALPPHRAGRRLHERQQVADRVRERRGVPIRPSSAEDRAQLAGGQRLLGKGLPAGIEDLADVHPGELPPERAARREPAIRHDLQHRPERQPVVGGHEMDGGPEHRCRPDDAALLEQPGELERIETLQSRPQLVVRVPGLLRLERDEVLDRALDRQVDALEQHLAGEQRAIERASTQDGIGHFESLRNGLDAGASHYGRNGIRRANTEGHRGPDRSRRAGKPGRS